MKKGPPGQSQQGARCPEANQGRQGEKGRQKTGPAEGFGGEIEENEKKRDQENGQMFWVGKTRPILEGIAK